MFEPHSGRRAVSLSKIHLPPLKVLVIPRKRWLRPDMTEKLFTKTLSLNPNKHNVLFSPWPDVLTIYTTLLQSSHPGMAGLKEISKQKIMQKINFVDSNVQGFHFVAVQLLVSLCQVLFCRSHENCILLCNHS